MNLFNRNHIQITKAFSKAVEKEPYCIFNYFGNGYSYDTYGYGKVTESEWVPEKIENVECESPLGFVYTKTVITPGYRKTSERYSYPKFSKPKNIAYEVYTLKVDHNIYTIRFPYKCDNVEIGTDSRPWDIADGGMDDKYVFELVKILDEICKEGAAGKAQWLKSDDCKWLNYNSNFSSWKRLLYKRLFDNEKGPRYQTNLEKILSHGFDPKTSFRNM